jgi:alpha-galactosidase
MKLKMWFKRCFMVLLVSIGGTFSHSSFAQKFEGLAKTPQMGWNSWNTFACDIDETMIKEMADDMVSSGLKAAGYEYINIDDCWHGQRDALGFIQADPKHFPSGMKALADYVHSKGLKLGIYSDAGNTTCAGRPGSRGHEYQDAVTYASWGIDYIKYDWCDTKDINPKAAYATMRDAVKKAGRPMLFSICEWGDSKPWEWAADVGHSWRTTGDIYPCWNCEHSHGSWSSWGVLRILDKQQGVRQYAGPGHWNDMDMLEVGNGMTEAEDRAHFSIWAMMASPLILGNDLRNMSETTRKILTNADIIAINQDTLGIQAMKWMDDGDVQVFVKPLENNEFAIMFLNRSDSSKTVKHEWTHHYMKDDIFKKEIWFDKQFFNWKSVWTNANGSTKKPLSVSIAAHDVLVLKLTPVN